MTWTDQPSAVGHVMKGREAPIAKVRPGNVLRPAALLVQELELQPVDRPKIPGAGAPMISVMPAGEMK